MDGRISRFGIEADLDYRFCIVGLADMLPVDNAVDEDDDG